MNNKEKLYKITRLEGEPKRQFASFFGDYLNCKFIKEVLDTWEEERIKEEYRTVYTIEKANPDDRFHSFVNLVDSSHFLDAVNCFLRLGKLPLFIKENPQ